MWELCFPLTIIITEDALREHFQNSFFLSPQILRVGCTVFETSPLRTTGLRALSGSRSVVQIGVDSVARYRMGASDTSLWRQVRVPVVEAGRAECRVEQVADDAGP